MLTEEDDVEIHALAPGLVGLGDRSTYGQGSQDGSQVSGRAEGGEGAGAELC